MPAIASDHNAPACASCGRAFSKKAWFALELVETIPPAAIARHVLRWPFEQTVDVRRCVCGGSVARTAHRGERGAGP